MSRSRERRRGSSRRFTRSTSRGAAELPEAEVEPKADASPENSESKQEDEANDEEVALRVKQEFEDRKQREIDEARRDDQTVLVLNLSLKVTERDVWKFFSENCGKVRDIQVIRDSRSGKSKGVGYVEFFTEDAVMKALALSGQILEGCAIKVQASQAEKNRAARLAKQQAVEAAEGGPMKVYVGGLVDSLANITEDELRKLFTPFGDVANVDLHKDPYTGKCRGFAFVQFCKANDAREAMAAMNGFEIAGRAIRVGFATESAPHGATPQATNATGVQRPQQSIALNAANQAAAAASCTPSAFAALTSGHHGSTTLASLAQVAAAQAAAAAALVDETPDTERLDDEGGGLLSGATTRIALMQKLQRGSDVSIPSVGDSLGLAGRLPPGLPGGLTAAQSLLGLRIQNAQANAVVAPPLLPTPGTVTNQPAGVVGLAGVPAAAGICGNPSHNLLLRNMFSAEQVLEDGPEFFDEISEDVTSECKKHGTVVELYVDRENPDGKIYVKFAALGQSLQAYSQLRGRLFAGNYIQVEFISDAIWAAIVSSSVVDAVA